MKFASTPHRALKTGLLFLMGAGLGITLTLSVPILAEKPAPAAEPAAKLALPIKELQEFVQVYARIKQDYVEKVEDKQLIHDAINGMLTGLDPHSTYLDEDAFKELAEGTKGEFGGLGMEIGMEDGLVRVTAPIDDTPAYRAGVKPGDYIAKANEALLSTFINT